MSSTAALSQSMDTAVTSIGGSTTVHQIDFHVAFKFPVIFTQGVFDTANPVLARTLCTLEPQKQHRVLVLLDESVASCFTQLSEQWRAYVRTHAHCISAAAEPIVVPGGEQAKQDCSLLDRIAGYIEEHSIDRHSFVLAIGGGAMLDTVGFAAATAHRGVRLIRMPTTVLAQNDAGIGVKNGVNRFGQKNWLGTFAPPFAVINDGHFLTTLGPTERRAGMAEAVKVALIKDAIFFHWIEANTQALASFEPNAVRYLIERCAQLHLQQISEGGDPFERGSARPLDFGHWAAHRLEKISDHKLSHGDAVAIGMVLDCHYSHISGRLSKEALKRIEYVLLSLGFALSDHALTGRDDQGERLILAGLADFQRHLGGQLSITLLSEIGVAEEVHCLDMKLLETTLRSMDSKLSSCD